MFKKTRLIIGCGNLLSGDEGIGVHLIEYLKHKTLPEDIELLDGGTAGFELIDFIQQAEKVIIIDAVKAGGRPGQIYCFGPQDFQTNAPPKTSLHGIGLTDIFGAIEKLQPLPKIKIIGAEPKDTSPGTELSGQLKQILPRLAQLALAEMGKM